MAENSKAEYRLLQGTHVQIDDGGVYRTYTAGDGQVLKLTEKEAADLGERVQKGDVTFTSAEKLSRATQAVADDQVNPADINASEIVTTPDVPVSADWSFTQSQTAAQVGEVIRSLGSRDQLLALKRAEMGGQNRVGVLKAIEGRLAQIGE